MLHYHHDHDHDHDHHHHHHHHHRHHHHHFPTVVPCVQIIFAALSHALAALLFQELPQLPGLLVGLGALLLKLLVGLRGRAMKAMEF